MKQFNILTVYPDFFESFKHHGLIKKSLSKKLIDINIVNLRDFTDDKHKHDLNVSGVELKTSRESRVNNRVNFWIK